MSSSSNHQLLEEMMRLYEQDDYLGVVHKARAVDRYNLSDEQILLLAASYFHLGRQDIDFFKAGTSFLLPLEHSSLNAHPQWHFYMGMSLFGICNYARAFKHFHEFLALNADNEEPMAKERQAEVAQRLKSCQAFLTLPFFNHSFARRVQNFWLKFENLLPAISLYADKLNHAKQEQRRTRSRSFHAAQSNCSEALEQVKRLLGALLPGQKFSLRFLPPNKSPAKFELIFPVGKFITRMHALQYFVSQANAIISNSEQFICTLGIPIYDNYDCQFGGHHINANDITVLIKLNEQGQWQDEMSHEIMLYSHALEDCTDHLRANLLMQLLYHNTGELATHMYFDVITLLDEADYQELLEHITYELSSTPGSLTAHARTEARETPQERASTIEPSFYKSTGSTSSLSSLKYAYTQSLDEEDDDRLENLEYQEPSDLHLSSPVAELRENFLPNDYEHEAALAQLDDAAQDGYTILEPVVTLSENIDLEQQNNKCPPDNLLYVQPSSSLDSPAAKTYEHDTKDEDTCSASKLKEQDASKDLESYEHHQGAATNITNYAATAPKELSLNEIPEHEIYVNHGAHSQYLQLPLTKLNDLMRYHSLVEHVDFNEYWLNNSLDIFSQVLFDNGIGGEISEDMDESIALRLEAFWTLTNCYELEDYMNEYDQSAALSCYDWGIMPCFLIIPLSNLKLPKSYFKQDRTLVQDKLESLKQKLLDYKKQLVERLYNHCQTQSFSCTGIALSHEFLFMDFMLWEPFCALAGLYEIMEQDKFEDVGIRSFHPYTSEMAVGDLGFTLNQTKGTSD